jgi:mono/diheme cytochrome c family protein
MKMKIVVSVLLFLVAMAVVGCGPEPTPEPPPTPTVHPGKAVVSSRCIGCHELNRVENAAYDKEGWQLTVDRMVLSGAQLTDEQVPLVVDYLAQAYPKE